MPTPKSALKRLRALRNQYGDVAERDKRMLLRALREAVLTTYAQLLALHEDLLFIGAFPGASSTRQLARRMLAATASRLQQLPRVQRMAADDTGMAGSSTRHIFPYPIARWLAGSAAPDIDIDWRTFDEPWQLDSLVGLMLRDAEREGFDSGEFVTRDWIRRSRSIIAPTDLAWLMTAGAGNPAVALQIESDWDAAQVPLTWALRDSRLSATHTVVAGAPIVVRHAMRRPDADTVATIMRPLPTIERLARPRARRVIVAARAALSVRCREVNAMTSPNVDEIYWCDLGEGTAMAVIGIAADQRLTLETNTGYLLFANGIPIGYGGVTPLFRQANTGINIFDPYRGGEAAFLWTQMLRAFHTLFGCDRFVVNAYQFGAGNAEAIKSGAFWFYYRLGFRPGVARVRTLAAREAARMAADRSYRSTNTTLRALATGDLYLDLPGFDAADGFDEALLPSVGALAAAQLALQPVNSRVDAERRLVAAVAEDLDIRDLATWSPAQRRGFALLAPVVASVQDLRDWTSPERAALTTMMRAKGAPQERDFALAARHVPRFFRGLVATLRQYR
ncbi:MAG: hypothetical protein ABI777_03425 [Betaproteobacteria bacterium]